MRWTCIPLIIAAVLLVHTQAAAETLLVPSEYATIQAGIDASADGDTVLVADGTYAGPGNRDLDFGGKAIVVMSENGPVMTIIDCEGSPEEPHRGFWFHSGEVSSSVLQGFTITNGQSWMESGGGIRCDTSSPTIVGNVITGNSSGPADTLASGGGIACLISSSPTIEGNLISENTSENTGGAIVCAYSSSPMITGNVIRDNFAQYSGGGILAYSSCAPSVIDNTVTGNSTGGGGGAISLTMYCSGSIRENTITGNEAGVIAGGIYCHNYSSPVIGDNVISENAAPRFGGIGHWSGASPTIRNNWILDNEATETGGGGIGMENYCVPTIEGNMISGNTAVLFGGGIAVREGSSPEIVGNRVTGNRVLSPYEGFGGGISISYGSAPTLTQNTIAYNKAMAAAGILCIYSSSATLFGNTITANEAGSPYGGGCGGLACAEESEVTITNTIFWNNIADVAKEIWVGDTLTASTVSISYSDVEGGQGSVMVFPGSILDWGEGMIDEDPLFLLPDKLDCRLLWGSSCIDTGDPDYTDPDGTCCDIGAHCFDQDDHLTLYVTPDVWVFPAGIEAGVTYTLINRWESPEPFWLLTQAILPDDTILKVDGPRSHTVPPGWTAQVHVSYRVPAGFPAGLSRGWSRVGMPPSTLYDEDRFTFLVTE